MAFLSYAAQTETDYFQKLNDDAIMSILYHLTIDDFVNLSLVSHKLYRVTSQWVYHYPYAATKVLRVAIRKPGRSMNEADQLHLVHWHAARIRAQNNCLAYRMLKLDKIFDRLWVYGWDTAAWCGYEQEQGGSDPISG